MVKDWCGVDMANLTAGWEGGGREGGHWPFDRWDFSIFVPIFYDFFANVRVVTQSTKRQLHLLINSLQMPQP